MEIPIHDFFDTLEMGDKEYPYNKEIAYCTRFNRRFLYNRNIRIHKMRVGLFFHPDELIAPAGKKYDLPIDGIKDDIIYLHDQQVEKGYIYFIVSHLYSMQSNPEGVLVETPEMVTYMRQLPLSWMPEVVTVHPELNHKIAIK